MTEYFHSDIPLYSYRVRLCFDLYASTSDINNNKLGLEIGLYHSFSVPKVWLEAKANIINDRSN